MRRPWFRRRRLRLLTWNVWFGLERPLRRSQELLGIASRLRPDVMAFQEVTAPFLELLLSQPWLHRYDVSDPSGATLEGYGNVIMTRFPQVVRVVQPFESAMGRKLILVEGDVGRRRWAFGCVHLESYRESSAARDGQLKQAMDRLDEYEHAALMGDFNFCSTWAEENARIPNHWVDAWSAAGEGPGWTVDTDRNLMRARHSGASTQVRIDRVLMKRSSGRVVSARLVGTSPIPGEFPEVWPSDHFGLFVELEPAGP